MFRQLALRQSNVLKSTQVRYLSASAPRSSILGGVKETLQKVNKKTGEVLAEGMEKAEDKTPHASSVGDAASKINKKTGEVLADGMQKVEDKAPNVDSVGDAASKANKKTGEVLADGMEKAEKVVPTASKADAKKKVDENVKGYDNLQHKGSRVETEQNRPDDAV